ncbi:MAG: thioredoxin-dependent thiol peroxidase [Alistipes putredinis]|nr:MAG: thioredoxin-dependent thiol peroxidase [Alistipes putredinis]
MAILKAGDRIPHFEIPDENGNTVSSSSLLGKRTILYFYPKDNTSGCTLEAQSLRDGRKVLAEIGFDIIGVSPDSQKSHQGFICKHSLNFPLLADTDKTLAQAFGVWAEKKMYGRTYMGILRTTFIIDADGVIDKVFDKVYTKNHWKQIAESYK